MPYPADLAILNATVVDGTGAAPRVTDVAVRGGRIERIGTLRDNAREVIDAYGSVLTPGFVDLHGHSDYSLLMDPLAHSKVCQGVTTEVGGNCGYHAAPVFGRLADERRAEMLRGGNLEVNWTSSAQYRSRFAEAKPSINYAQQIGYNSLLSSVTGDAPGPLTSSQRAELRRLVREELDAGAVGLSYGLAYAPACFSRLEELVDVAYEARLSGAFLSFHLRSEDSKLVESVEEALAIGRESGAPVHIGHLKTFRRANWSKLDRVLEMLNQARTAGMDLTVDRYPHLAMNTQLKFALPLWALEGGLAAMTERLRDRATRAKVVAELHATASDEAREVLISLVSRPENKHVEGRFLDDLAGDGDPWELACQLLASEGESAFATFFGMCSPNLDRILSLNYAMVASDASVQAIAQQLGAGRPHPRCFDTFPFFLAEWVFSRQVISLQEAVRKMTYLPAQRAQLVDRGLLAEGAFADMVLFDPSALLPKVSYEEPIRYPSGIRTVIVNGKKVVDRGRHLGTRPGRFLVRGA